MRVVSLISQLIKYLTLVHKIQRSTSESPQQKKFFEAQF